MRGSLVLLQRRLLLLAAILLPVLVPLLLVANFGKPDVAPVPIAVVDAPDRTKDGPAASLATDRDEPRVGDVQILPSFKTISHSIVRSELKRHEPASRSIVFSSNSTGAMTFVAAPSLNWMLSVPNAYLLGRVPYAVSQAWMPLYMPFPIVCDIGWIMTSFPAGKKSG